MSVGQAIDYRLRLFYQKYSISHTIACPADSLGQYELVTGADIDLIDFLAEHFGMLEAEDAITKALAEDRTDGIHRRRGFKKLKQRVSLWLQLWKLFTEISAEGVNRVAPQDTEERLARCCVILSRYEQEARTGQPDELLAHAKSLEELLAAVPIETYINNEL